MDYIALDERLKRELSKKRYLHTLGCRDEAVSLAKRWGADEDLASDAALLHDITKELSPEFQLKLCEKFDIIPNHAEKLSPVLLHGVTAAEVARREYDQPDEVASAIRYHTTGREGMTLLEKVLFIADFIEPTRTFKHDELTKYAYEDIDRAILFGLSWSIKEVVDKGLLLHPDTIEGYNSLLWRKYQTE